MKHALKDTWVFLALMSLWLLIGAIVMVLTDQLELHLWFNDHHHSIADIFYTYATMMAEGVFAGFIAVLIFFRKVRYGVMAVISFSGAGVLSQLLKRGVFPEIKRPSKVFEGLADLHFVDGVSLHSSYSFPSGHATEAFAIFFLLGFVLRHRVAQVICFGFAIMVASSRVYLSQHFFEDIYAGSVLGTGFTLIIIAIFRDRKWGEQGLLATFDRKR